MLVTCHVCITYILTAMIVTLDATHIPGSLSSIVMNAVLGEPISAALGWSVEVIATLKYSANSVVLSSMVDTIKVAYI